MKKIVFTLALLLMSLSAAVAQTWTFKITHAVARNSKVNQMYVTTKSGDVKYYNTADLTSVKYYNTSHHPTGRVLPQRWKWGWAQWQYTYTA